MFNRIRRIKFAISLHTNTILDVTNIILNLAIVAMFCVAAYVIFA